MFGKNSMRTFAIVGAGVGSFFLFTDKGKDMLNRFKNKFHSTQKEDLLSKAGNPAPDDIGDNNMVNEGAMYSVHYYNKQRNNKVAET
ncbi:hypothetical protein [Niallia sp.]|uniref:hypothetical protein n=1 Tax=Niallia sp. TaxID=2837523 RepID=UPI00289E590A|nr:hypothetical protein [Niallia sp.]